MPVLPDFDTLKRADDVPDFDTLKPVTRTGTNVPESPPHTEEADAPTIPISTRTTSSGSIEPSKIKLDPYQESFLKTGLLDPSRTGEGAFTAELATHLPSDISNLARSIPADIAAGFRALGTGPTEASQFSGNIVAALQRESMPIDKALSDISVDSPAWSTIGKLSQGIAATAPMAVIGGLPKALQTAALIGFTGKMISDAPGVAKALGDELGKPKEQQDQDKISSLVSDAIQIVGFSALGGKAIGKGGAVKLGAEPTLAATAEAIKPVAPLTTEAVKEVAQIPEKPTEVPITKEKGPQDAIRKQKPDAGVLRQERPEVGLPQMGARDKGVEETPAAQESKAPTEQKITSEEQSALQKSQRGEDLTVSEEEALKSAESKTPTVTETTPPVPPEEMPTTPTETGFRPAIRLVGGKVVVGDAGKIHNDIIKEHGLKAEEIDQRGFVDEQGKFHDREQTAQATGVPTQREAGRQHSTDLPEATSPASPQSVAGKEGVTPSTEAKAGELTKGKKPETLVPAAPETITGGSGAERTTQEQTGSAIPAEGRLSSRSAASISQELKEAKAKDKALAKQIDSLNKIGATGKSSDLQAERNEIQKRLSDLTNELKDKRAELTKKRLKRGIRSSQSEQDRPDDLIDELKASLGGHISLRNARTLIENFKPIGAARELFAQEGYAPDVAHQSVSHFKDYGSDVAFLEAVNESARGRITTREKATREKKGIATEEQQHTAFVRDAKHPGPASDVILPETLFPGDEIAIGGTKLKVKSFEFDDNGDVTSVELEDGAKYGTQHVEAGTKLFIDSKSLKEKPPTEFAPKETTTPQLRPGEKSGEMFQGEDQPFNLSGEKGIDTARVALEKAQADKTKLEAAEMSAKQQQTLPGAEEPQLRGMGAALVGEVDRPESFVSNMFAAIDADRKAMGKEPMPDTQKRSWDEDNTKALNKMNRDPDWIPNLITEVLKRPRPLLSWENAGLVWHRQKLKAELNNALQRISTAYEGGVEESLTEAKVDAAVFEDKLEELDRAVGRSGTGSEAGRTLQAQKMGAGDDFTLIEMRLQKRAAVGGRPLTDTESAEIQKLHEQITAATKAHETELATKDQRLAEMANKLEVERIAREAIKQPVIPPHIKIVADKIKTYFDNRADAALKRLSGKTFTISPQVLADLTDLGVSRILSGAIEFTEWSVKMAEALGEKVKPHLKTIWEASQSALNDHIVKVAGEGVRSDRVKRAVKGTDIKEQQSNVTKTIKDRMDEGKKNEITYLVQKLSRLFVEQGIKERDPLIDAVHGVLKEIDPEFSRRETMDAISGYGDFRQLSKDTISKELRDLKGQMQQVAKLEDMQSGEPPLKTGLERRIPSKEESRLIKMVNDAKHQFQIPISDPATQLKSSLDTLKTRMQTRIDELNRKIADKDYRPKQKREIVLDRSAMASKATLDRLVKKYREGLVADRLANRTRFEKALDWTTKLRRFDVLSSPVVIPKLFSAGAQRLASVIPEDLSGEVWRHIPGVDKIADKSPLEGGGVNLKATMKGFGATFNQGLKDAHDVLKTGHSELDVLYGKASESYTGEFELGSKLLALPGRIHGMIKAPVKRARFEDAVQRLGEYYAKQGLDVTDDMVKTRIAVDAYKAAQRSIFLQDNKIASMFNAAMRRAEQPDKGETAPSIGGKLAAATGRIVFPIVRVPLNIVAETFQYAAGLGTGGIRLSAALIKGMEKVKPEEADLIMRELKKGSVGGAVLALGYFGADSIGGYYQPGHKKKEGDLKWGAIRVFDHDIPSYLLHNPLLETLQIGATIRHVAESKLRKKDTEAQGIASGIGAAALGVVEQVPFIREQAEIEKLRNPYTRGQFLGEQAKSLVVPAVVQKSAEWTDPEKKRKPTTVLEHIKSGIPGLREQVPAAP